MPSKAFRIGSLRSISAAVLSIILMSLTVSLPYAMPTDAGSSSCLQEEKPQTQCPGKGGDQKPWNDMAEEKAAENSNTPSEEYIQENHSGPEAGSMDRNRFVTDMDDTPCIAFHGELLVPPPNTL